MGLHDLLGDVTRFIGRSAGGSKGPVTNKESSGTTEESTGTAGKAAAANGTDEDEIIDLRESDVVLSLRAELRAAQEEIAVLQAENADLHSTVRRKDQAVAEVRNTLRSVRDSLMAGGDPTPIITKPTESDSLGPQEVTDLQRRLKTVTGELAEVTRRHRREGR